MLSSGDSAFGWWIESFGGDHVLDVGVELSGDVTLATELDAMRDRGTLAVAASIAAGVTRATARAWSQRNRRLPRTPQLDQAVAQLARSAAGAFRELRQPYRVLATLAPFGDEEQVFEGSPQALKMHEARQDVQLAFQRTGLFEHAAAAFERTLAQMNWYFEYTGESSGDLQTVLVQKRREVTEQLGLGRVGGLVQQAEALICAGRALESVRILYQAHSAVDDLLAELQLLQLEHLELVDASDFSGYLRYTDRWEVMPSLMKYRVAVAKVLAVSTGAVDYDTRRDARRCARDARVAAEALSHLFTERHLWELQRTRVITALWEDEIHLEQEVDKVVTAGGDDGVGDYVLPLLRWASTVPSLSERVSLSAFTNSIVKLQALPIGSAPRLPDLRALGG